jgi:putative peptidoglycan lipid II flippase
MKFYDRLDEYIGTFRRSLSGRIFGTTVRVSVLVLLVKCVALLKEMMIARRFGASDALDAVYVAVLLPGFLSTVIGDALNAAFIPAYIEVRETQGEQAAQQLFSTLGAIGLSALAVIALLLAGSGRWFLPVFGSSFGPAKLALTSRILLIILASFAFTALKALWQSTLNANYRYTLTAIIPLATPITILLALLAGRAWGIYALAIGMVAGSFGELAVTGFCLRADGIRLLPYWYGMSAAVRTVLRQGRLLLAGALLISSTAVVDQSMAAMLGPGSVATLNYATKLLSMMLSVSIYALSIALLPSLSSLSAGNKWEEMRELLSNYTRLLLLVSVPATLCVMYFSEPLVAMLFQGGAFTSTTSRNVASVQTLLCIQMPFLSVGMLYAQGISSLKRNELLLWGTMISVTLNAALNLFFMRFLGLPGIALSTSAVYAISCWYLRAMFFRALKKHEASGIGLSSEYRSEDPSVEDASEPARLFAVGKQ